MSTLSPVQSSSMIHAGSPEGARSLFRWEGFVENIGFEPRVKEWQILRVVMMRKMGWQVHGEVNGRDWRG